jgi:hypothetical protein
MLPNCQLERIRDIHMARTAMQRIRLVNPRPQRLADDSQIFELQRSGGEYSFLHIDPDATHMPMPLVHGAFLFVILANDPGRIYCGAPIGTFAADSRFAIAGHTSITRREDVFYAGEIFFNRGRLLSWNNCSGHYTPPQALRNVNLIPAVRRLLPDECFVDAWSTSTEQPRQQLEMRGYVVVRE